LGRDRRNRLARFFFFPFARSSVCRRAAVIAFSHHRSSLFFFFFLGRRASFFFFLVSGGLSVRTELRGPAAPSERAILFLFFLPSPAEGREPEGFPPFLLFPSAGSWLKGAPSLLDWCEASLPTFFFPFFPFSHSRLVRGLEYSPLTFSPFGGVAATRTDRVMAASGSFADFRSGTQSLFFFFFSYRKSARGAALPPPCRPLSLFSPMDAHPFE